MPASAISIVSPWSSAYAACAPAAAEHPLAPAAEHERRAEPGRAAPEDDDVVVHAPTIRDPLTAA